MRNEMIKVTVEAKGLNEILNRYGIELICSNPSDADTIAIGQTPSQYRKGIVAVIITQTPSQYRKGIATMTIREDVYKTIEKDLSIVCNNSINNKEETIMTNNTNNTETNNSEIVEKEKTTMRELMNNTINRIETATKVQDSEYVTRDELADIMEQLTGVRPGKKVTRKQMVQDLYMKCLDMNYLITNIVLLMT